jgi:cytochrome c oxidase subunit 4
VQRDAERVESNMSDEASQTSNETHEHHDQEHHVHVMPMKVLLGVFAALLFLTWVTVAVARPHLVMPFVQEGDFGGFGQWSILVALSIAVVKGSLVGLYFMHLRYDAPFNGVILITALVFVALFIGISLLDTVEYADNYQVPRIVETTQ